MGGIDEVHRAPASAKLSACRSTFRRYALKSARSLSELKRSLKLVSATQQPKISSNFPMSPAFCEGNLHLPQLSMTQGRRMSKLPRKMEIIPGKSLKIRNLSASAGCITPTPAIKSRSPSLAPSHPSLAKGPTFETLTFRRTSVRVL